MPQVMPIEQQCFVSAWTEADFIHALRPRNCIGMVAEIDERVVGYMIYELHKCRFHLLNFAVHSEFRRQGVGSVMIQKLVGKLSYQRRHLILLECSDRNLVSQLFFRSLGFKATSVLRDFYDNDEGMADAYLMQYRHKPTGDELFPTRSLNYGVMGS